MPFKTYPVIVFLEGEMFTHGNPSKYSAEDLAAEGNLHTSNIIWIMQMHPDWNYSLQRLFYISQDLLWCLLTTVSTFSVSRNFNEIWLNIIWFVKQVRFVMILFEFSHRIGIAPIEFV